MNTVAGPDEFVWTRGLTVWALMLEVALDLPAHGFHHRVVGHGHLGLKPACERAVAPTSCGKLLRWDASPFHHCVLNAEQEHFLGATETLCGLNDYLHFLRAKPQRHDQAAPDSLHEL